MLYLNLIAAVEQNLGLGFENDLPWNLPKEYEFFKRIVLSCRNGKKNIGIWGRKSWQSPKNDDRPQCIPIVLSKTLKEVPKGACYLARDVDEVLEIIDKIEDEVDKVFVCGGSQVYEEFMKSPRCKRIYLTRIYSSYKCDSFFPKIDQTQFKISRDSSVSDEIQKENGIEYKFNVYDKI